MTEQPKIIRRKTVVRRVTLGDRVGRAATLGVLCVAGACVLRRALRGVADLRGQVVLITGGSRGLGLMMARHFAAAGCKIAICARDEKELRRAQDELQRGNVEIFTVVCDIAQNEQVEQMTQAVTAHYGQIDILVNNASILQVGPIEAMNRDDFEAAMNVNFWGMYNVTQAVLPEMRRRRSGRIVNITSIASEVPMPHLMPYNCAKAAALGFSRSLHMELAKDGIAVTSVLPGLMRTGSILAAKAKGHAKAEWAIFSIAGSLPGLTLRADDAARQIVQATKRGQAEVVLGAQFALLARIQGLFPGCVGDALGLVNRALPRTVPGSATQLQGDEARQKMNSPLLEALLRPNLEAAERLNQHSGEHDSGS